MLTERLAKGPSLTALACLVIGLVVDLDLLLADVLLDDLDVLDDLFTDADLLDRKSVV